MKTIKWNNLEITPIMREMLVWDNDENPINKLFVICKVTHDYITFKYKCIKSDGNVIGYKNAKEITPIETKPRTIEDGLVYGDIIVNIYGYKRKVLGVVDEVIIISKENDFSKAHLSYTLQELIANGFKLYQEQPVKSITIKEAQEMLKEKGVNNIIIE